jgi:protein-S-isoprenylcysteine O-methyltransferase Ste14
VSVPADVTIAVWALFELSLRIRERVQGQGGRARDRGTRVLIAVTLGAALGLAGAAASLAESWRLPEAARAAGLVLMVLGLALRIWSVAALGGAFRTTVEVSAGQAVVSGGPYTWIRHPAYAGLLLILAGFGLTRGNWLSFAACVVLPLPAIVRRIHVEEAELIRVLGDAYRTYRTGTARLVPRMW